MKRDETDERLLVLLRRNGRATVSELAETLGVARATVRARMERLAAGGEILGYSVVLKSDVVEMPVRGLTMIAIAGRGTERVIGRLAGMAEVAAIHTTSGKWDLVVEVGARTLAELDDVLRRIRLIDGIATSETNLLMATRKSADIRPRARR
ncbi:MAG: Lrp/AsnC family transcriptional regulator [Paracoccaceae bacterium]